MIDHKVGTREEWVMARAELLGREKEYTRAGDDLARKRQELPWVAVDKEYRFDIDDSTKKSLADLFDGRSQLVVYQFMFGPDYEAGCPACSATADSFDGVQAHLEACDVTMICISRAPIQKLLAYRERMGWSFNWVSSYDSDFNFDFGVSAATEPTHASEEALLLEANELTLLKLLNDHPEVGNNLPEAPRHFVSATRTSTQGYFSEGHGIATFARNADTIYHCYSTYARGTEFLMGYYAILDRAPKGRGERDQPMSWLRRHDEYGV